MYILIGIFEAQKPCSKGFGPKIKCASAYLSGARRARINSSCGNVSAVRIDIPPPPY
ncbi:MAG: hypothetical protein QNJ54_32150 [Prochloraceae cyanobacterium]|nr:hypothetical protein [Prochloraceae cyanobacterium]